MFKVDFEIDGMNFEIFIIFLLEWCIVLIGGIEYVGEMKKFIFLVMNFLFF